MTDWPFSTMQLLGIYGGGGVVLAVIAVYFLFRTVARLRTMHPDIWQSLSRSGDTGTPLSGWKATFRYVLSGKYRAVGDPNLKAYGDLVRLLMAGIVVEVLTLMSILSLGYQR